MHDSGLVRKNKGAIEKLRLLCLALGGGISDFMAYRVDIDSIKGFLDPEEGQALQEAALEAAVWGPCLEIGSYCGKSTIYYGTACQMKGTVLFALDHHCGSEENQPGEAYHDPDLYNAQTGRMDTLPTFRDTLRRAELEDSVIPLVASSALAARQWATPLAMVFIDGGHSMATAWDDYRLWTPHLMTDGILAIHDVFPNPADGGRPPYEVCQIALMSGAFTTLQVVKSLWVLRRNGGAIAYEKIPRWG
ncbi:MAG: class I SAM-dependent methyltransferase [Parvularculales bacterium]